MRKRTVTVNDKMQKDYRYVLRAAVGRSFDPEFRPQLTPAQMLKLGVFGGKYMTDCRREFPKSWFAGAKLSPRGRDRTCNFFGVDASQPLSEWRRKGWITRTTRAAGSSGIAATTWAGACRMRTAGRSSAGRRSAATCGKCRNIANPATCSAGAVSVRCCCTGPTTAAKFDEIIRPRRRAFAPRGFSTAPSLHRPRQLPNRRQEFASPV